MPFGQNSLSARNKDARPNKNTCDYSQWCTVFANNTHRAIKSDFRTVSKRETLKINRKTPFSACQRRFLSFSDNTVSHRPDRY